MVYYQILKSTFKILGTVLKKSIHTVQSYLKVLKSKSYIRNLTVHVWSDIQNTIRSKCIWPSQRKRWNCSGNFGRFSQNCKHIDLKPKQEAAIRQDGLAIQIFKYLWEWRRKFHNLLHAFSWSYSLLHLSFCFQSLNLNFAMLLGLWGAIYVVKT